MFGQGNEQKRQIISQLGKKKYCLGAHPLASGRHKPAGSPEHFGCAHWIQLAEQELGDDVEGSRVGRIEHGPGEHTHTAWGTAGIRGPGSVSTGP